MKHKLAFSNLQNKLTGRKLCVFLLINEYNIQFMSERAKPV